MSHSDDDVVTWTEQGTFQIQHEHKKKITSPSPYFLPFTNMPFYDGIIEYPDYHRGYKGICAVMEEMSPDDYIDACASNRRDITTIEEELRGISDKRINEYYERALKGEKMPLIVIDRRTCGQEGRHRAMVAKRLGLKRIPVLIVKDC